MTADTPALAPAQKPRARNSSSRRPRTRFRGAVWFMAPSILLTFVFVYGFIGFSGLISLSSWKRPTRRDLTLREPLGATYGEMFKEQRFQADMRNVVIFKVLFLLVTVIGGLVMALLVHNVVVARGLFRFVFLLPYALSFIVTGVAFRWIFNPNSGINVWLRDLGISNPPKWSTDSSVALAVFRPSGEGFLQIDLGIPMALLPIIIAAAWQL